MVREKQNIASFRHEQRYRRKKEEKTKVEDGHSLLSATESKNFKQYTLSLTKEKSKYFCDHERYKDTLSKPRPSGMDIYLYLSFFRSYEKITD